MAIEFNIETIIFCVVIYILNKLYTDYEKRQNWNLFFNSVNCLSNYSNFVKNMIKISNNGFVDTKSESYRTSNTTNNTTNNTVHNENIDRSSTNGRDDNGY